MSDCCSVNGKRAVAPSVMACPVNGARSKKADLLTVRSLVRHLPMGMPSAQYYFCEAPGCDVVYFSSNPQAPIFRRAELLVRVGAKESEDPIPVCYCFGFTRKDLQDEIAQTSRSTVAARITAEVQAGNCACEVKNPSGKCCLGAVTRTVQEFLRAMPKAREEIAGQRKVVGGGAAVRESSRNGTGPGRRKNGWNRGKILAFNCATGELLGAVSGLIVRSADT